MEKKYSDFINNDNEALYVIYIRIVEMLARLGIPAITNRDDLAYYARMITDEYLLHIEAVSRRAVKKEVNIYEFVVKRVFSLFPECAMKERKYPASAVRKKHHIEVADSIIAERVIQFLQEYQLDSNFAEKEVASLPADKMLRYCFR